MKQRRGRSNKEITTEEQAVSQLGPNIRRFLSERKKTQSWLAEEIGWGRNASWQISEIIHNKRGTTYATIRKIARALQVSPKDLVDD